MATALQTAQQRELVPAGARAPRGPTMLSPRPGPAPAPRVIREPGNGAASPAATRVGAAYSPRRNVNPAERRQRVALFVCVLLLVAGMVAGAVALAPGNVAVPSLRGLTRGRADSLTHRHGLRAQFGRRYSDATRGTVIAQAPHPGTRVSDGSTIRVTLSAGPAPVPVPELVNSSTTAAESALGHLKLRASLTQVPAPGVAVGTVTQQSPRAGIRLTPGSTVVLSVAEAPRWRGLTSFAGGHSVPFRIRGTRWQLVYGMSYQGTCTLIFICSGPSATVRNLSTGATVDHFDLGEGSGRSRSLTSGPGVYEITISPGSDSARWSVRVEDYY